MDFDLLEMDGDEDADTQYMIEQSLLECTKQSEHQDRHPEDGCRWAALQSCAFNFGVPLKMLGWPLKHCSQSKVLWTISNLKSLVLEVDL